MLNTKSGVSIYLAVMIMAVLLAVVLGLNTILVGQIKTIRNMGYSVTAFYAAETGIEQALYTEAAVPLTPLGESTYQVIRLDPTDSGCFGDNYCLQSVGAFKGIKRAIQVSR